jgi:hypothetical protein
MLGLTSLAFWFIILSVLLGMFVSNNIHGKVTFMAIPYMAFLFTFSLVTYTGTIPPVASLAVATLAFIYYGRATQRGVSLPGGDSISANSSWAS